MCFCFVKNVNVADLLLNQCTNVEYYFLCYTWYLMDGRNKHTTISGGDIDSSVGLSLNKQKRWETFNDDNKDIKLVHEYAGSGKSKNQKQYEQEVNLKNKQQHEKMEKQLEEEAKAMEKGDKFQERKQRKLEAKKAREAAKQKKSKAGDASSSEDEEMKDGEDDDDAELVYHLSEDKMKDKPMYLSHQSGRISPEWALGIEKNHQIKKRRNARDDLPK